MLPNGSVLYSIAPAASRRALNFKPVYVLSRSQKIANQAIKEATRIEGRHVLSLALSLSFSLFVNTAGVSLAPYVTGELTHSEQVFVDGSELSLSNFDGARGQSHGPQGVRLNNSLCH